MGSSVAFSETRFLHDIRATAAILEAPFSERVTCKVIDSFADNFKDGATVWKATEHAGDPLSYRFFARSRNDTIQTALRVGLLGNETDCTTLIRRWSDAYGDTTQSCDFDTLNGLAKSWIYLGGMRPADEVLGRSFVPQVIRDQLRIFHAVRLDYIRFVAVDYRHETANLYFRTRGPITPTRCTEILALVGLGPPPPEVVAEIRRFVPEDFCVAVTVSMRDGKLERVCFYALKLPPGELPAVPERIARFFAKAPSHDACTVNVLGWSFGPEGGTYIKAEKGYLGDMAALLADWDCYFSGSIRKDRVLGTVA